MKSGQDWQAGFGLERETRRLFTRLRAVGEEHRTGRFSGYLPTSRPSPGAGCRPGWKTRQRQEAQVEQRERAELLVA
jgi:hypothetical protein